MIEHPAFPVEEWSVRERGFHLDVLPQTESLFALSNGHIGLRANLDEGEPHGVPGTYLNSFYEVRPLPYAEAGYGYPEAGQTVVNVTNGKIIRLLVDDEPFDVRYGTLHSHERVLDFRTGVLTRRVEWESPAHRHVRVTSRRLVSFTQRSVAAFGYEVEPGHSLRIAKFVSYGWSSERSAPALRDQADGALASAERRGWDGLAADQEAFLKDFWNRADVELDGDPEIQQAIRFAMFHVLQA